MHVSISFNCLKGCIGVAFFTCSLVCLVYLQEDDGGASAEISKREKARLKEMQKMKKQKIQEILDAQNATIDADMVRVKYGMTIFLTSTYV